MKPIVKAFLVGCALTGFTFAGFAQTAAEIIEKSVNLPTPDSSTSQLQQDLYENGKLVESRVILQYGRRHDGLVDTVFDMKSPASVKDSRILKLEKGNKADDTFVYLPSLRTTRRLAAAERQKSFFGTDFTYDDIKLRSVDEDNQEMIKDNVSITVGGVKYDCWEIRSTPIKKNVEFAYREQFIDKKTFLPVQVDYYEKKTEKLLKTYTIEKISVMPSSVKSGVTYLIREVNKVHNHTTNHSTVVTVKKIETDKPMSDKYYTQNWLSTGK